MKILVEVPDSLTVEDCDSSVRLYRDYGLYTAVTVLDAVRTALLEKAE